MPSGSLPSPGPPARPELKAPKARSASQNPGTQRGSCRPPGAGPNHDPRAPWRRRPPARFRTRQPPSQPVSQRRPEPFLYGHLTTGAPSTSAFICSHTSCLAPDPTALNSRTSSPRRCMHSFMLNAVPSSTALSICHRLWPGRRPTNAPAAPGPCHSLRAPVMCGMKTTPPAPGRVRNTASSSNPVQSASIPPASGASTDSAHASDPPLYVTGSTRSATLAPRAAPPKGPPGFPAPICTWTFPSSRTQSPALSPGSQRLHEGVDPARRHRRPLGKPVTWAARLVTPPTASQGSTCLGSILETEASPAPHEAVEVSTQSAPVSLNAT